MRFSDVKDTERWMPRSRCWPVVFLRTGFRLPKRGDALSQSVSLILPVEQHVAHRDVHIGEVGEVARRAPAAEAQRIDFDRYQAPVAAAPELRMQRKVPDRTVAVDGVEQLHGVGHHVVDDALRGFAVDRNLMNGWSVRMAVEHEAGPSDGA